MKALLLFALLIGLTMAADPATYGYYGMRVSINTKTLLNENFYLLEKMFSGIGDKTFNITVEDATGSGITRQGLTLSNIRAPHNITFKSTELKNGAYDLDKGIFTYNASGPGVAFDIEFDWDFEFLGIHAFFGEGTAKLVSKNFTLVQNYTTGFPSSDLKIQWDMQNLDISGVWAIGKMKKWIAHMMTTTFTSEFHKEIDEDAHGLLDSKVLEPFQRIPLDLPNHENVTIINTFDSSAEFTANNKKYGVFSFKTNVTVDNRPFNKAVWRKIFTESKPSSDVEVCYNYEIIPDILEVLGKSRYLVMVIDLKKINLTSTVNDLIDILPSLADNFPSNEPIEMGCMESNDATIIDLRIKDHPEMHVFQIPMLCRIIVNSTGQEIIHSTVYYRYNYTMEYDNKGGIYGYINAGSVHYLDSTQKLDPTDRATLMTFYDRVGNMFNGINLYNPPTIRISGNREMKYVKTTVMDSEVCVNYSLD